MQGNIDHLQAELSTDLAASNAKLHGETVRKSLEDSFSHALLVHRRRSGVRRHREASPKKVVKSAHANSRRESKIPSPI